MAQGVRQQLDSIPGGKSIRMRLEVGNEPDIDGARLDFYHDEQGWEDQWAAFATNLTTSKVIPGSCSTGGSGPAFQPEDIVGGVWASCGWCKYAGDYVTRRGSLLGEVNVHWYPLIKGSKPGMGDLLSDMASLGSLRGHGYDVAAQHVRSQGKRFTIRESNNINMGGMPGVSDRFGAALWAVDALFSAASIGSSTWHFNTGTGCGTKSEGTPYAPFCVDQSKGWGPGPRVGPPLVRPAYYGIVAFARAALQDGGGESSMPLVQTMQYNFGDNVVVWAVHRRGNQWDGLGASKQVLVVVVANKNLVSMPGQPNAPSATNVSICVRGAPTQAPDQHHDKQRDDSGPAKPWLEWMQAPKGAGAADGVTLAGQTFDGTKDGRPTGPVHREPVQPSAPGVCSEGMLGLMVPAPAETAAFVYIPLD